MSSKRKKEREIETGIARCRLKACPSYNLIILCISEHFFFLVNDMGFFLFLSSQSLSYHNYGIILIIIRGDYSSIRSSQTMS